MKLFASLRDPKLAECLKNSGVVIIPTDTLYGLVARAEDEAAVSRLYKIRKRGADKPCIVLVGSREQITDDGAWTALHEQLAKKYWPGPLSLVAPITSKTPDYLRHPKTFTVAYRVPANDALRELLLKTGPLIAPSANLEGRPPATIVQEAELYFGTEVDGYVDGGDLSSAAPSTLVTVQDGHVITLRAGALAVLEAE